MPTRDRSGTEGGDPDAPEIPGSLKEALRPWIDLDEVGLEGLLSWLESVVPLLPTSSRSGSERTRELARALAACGQDRARLNVAAAQYFRDNQALARRVKALESMLAQRGAPRDDAPVPVDPESERAAERYLPPPRDGRLTRIR